MYVAQRVKTDDLDRRARRQELWDISLVNDEAKAAIYFF